MALLLRLVVARDFFLSGQAKAVGPTFPLSFQRFDYSLILPAQVSDETLRAFEARFATSPVSPMIIANFVLYAEFLLPICLVLGFGTRISALLLLIVTVLLQLYVEPAALWTMHVYWFAILLGADDMRSRRDLARPAHSVALSEVNFASDNTAPVAPAILDAIVQANHGYARGYGNDDWTQRVERRLSEVFEREVAVFLVPTGTAANALALAHVTPPWGVVMCHAESHIVTDECGAPEFFGGGLKLVGLPGGDGKITPETLKTALAGYGGHSPHQMVASALSLTQASEAGTIYRTDEIAALCEIAHRRSLAVHMDGARFANALVRLNASPAQMTWQSGVDVLSFGATKGGALAAEAVVVFDPARAAFIGERRKRAGHLLSKHRFLAVQFAAYLEDGRWLALARHANAMADRLAHKLTAIGLPPVWPVEANMIFVVLPRALDAQLKAAGASYYVRSSERLKLGADKVLVRLVTSFATANEDVDCFVEGSETRELERFVNLCEKSSELRPSAALISVNRQQGALAQSARRARGISVKVNVFRAAVCTLALWPLAAPGHAQAPAAQAPLPVQAPLPGHRLRAAV